MELPASQILLVDHHPLLRAGLAVAIRREPDLEVAAQVGTAADAIRVLKQQPIHVAVVPVLMPASSGLSLAPQLLELQPTLHVLALSTLDNPMVISAMLRAGASGYALKTQEAHEIVHAIRTIRRGDVYLPPHVDRETILRRRDENPGLQLDRLSRREREVFDLIIHGHTNEQIGARLFISRRTVDTHRQRILQKLAVHSVLDLLRLAAREGALIDNDVLHSQRETNARPDL